MLCYLTTRRQRGFILQSRTDQSNIESKWAPLTNPVQYYLAYFPNQINTANLVTEDGVFYWPIVFFKENQVVLLL